MTHFDERMELVDREEVLDPVAQVPGDVTGVVPECLGYLKRLPAVMLVLQFSRQEVPVIESSEGLDAGCQAFRGPSRLWESSPFLFGLPVPDGKIRGQEMEKRYAFTPMAFINFKSSL